MEFDIGELILDEEFDIGELELIEEIDIGEIQFDEEFNIGDLELDEEFDIGIIELGEEIDVGDIELDVVVITPFLEDLEITPSTEEQNFKSNKGGYNKVKVEAIPEEYVVPKVIDKTLILSRVNINEGRLILWMN